MHTNFKVFNSIWSILGFSLLFMLFSCTVQKKKGEYKGIRKFYHNTTAKYNAYFNANELMDLTMAKIDASKKDNFNKILALFPYEAIEDITPEKPNLDKIIEKVASDISLHRYSRWADDCYLILAKAQYLKKDYETAENSYEFMLNEYQPKRKLETQKKSTSSKSLKKEKEQKKEDAKKEAKRRAKEREKARKKSREAAKKNTKKGEIKKDSPKEEIYTPEKRESKKKDDKKDELKIVTNEGSKLIPHYPIFWEASIWAAKNLIKRGKFYEAEYKLIEIESDPATDPKLKGELYATKANLYIIQDQNEKAVTELKKAIELTKSRKTKARYSYILGQLYQLQDRPVSSDEYFEKVLKYHPSYEMTFHAKMNLFINKSKQGGDNTGLISDLEKLTKDPKNSEYLSELYFNMAKIHLNTKNYADAIARFNQCIQSSIENNYIKSEAYLALGNISFDQAQFQQAKYYYDSTLTLLGKNDKRRGMVDKLIYNLKDIAAQLEIINLQDSLLRISNYTLKEKRALAIYLKNKNKAVPAQENLGNNLMGMDRGALSSPDFMNRVNQRDFQESRLQNNNNGGGKSSFFAYDIKVSNRGRGIFEQTWGNRELEDNWRRSKKNLQANNNITFENQESDSLSKNEFLEADLAEFLKGIPETAEQKNDAHRIIMEAMFQLGVAYRDKIEAYDRSQKTLETLLSKYPNTDRQADVLYYMYMNCLDLRNNECATKYKELLSTRFADSYYSKLLNDPEFAKSQLNKKDQLQLAYEKAYQLYDSGRYEECHKLVQALKTKLADNRIMRAKADMLSAFCIGKSDGKDAYMAALKDIVANYPGTEQESKAKEMLRFLRGDKEAFEPLSVTEVKQAEFKIEDEKNHFILIVFFNPPPKQTDKSKISISDYHQKYNKLDNLKMVSVELNTDTNLSAILIRKFDDKAQSMKYLASVTRNRDEYIPGYQGYEVYPITQNNYRILLELRSVKEYQEFYKNNYEN